MADKERLDSIFEDTKDKEAKADKPAKKPAKKKTATKAAAKKTTAAADSKAKPEPKADDTGNDFEVDRFSALKSLLRNHEEEVLYRKAKEDRMMVVGCTLLAAMVFGAMLVLATDISGGWFGRLIFRLFFAAGAALAGLAAGSMIELNRKRLQDLLTTIVKIHERFGFFEEGLYAGSSAFLPSTYKFIGSINDDETNYAQLIVKIATAGAVVAILILS